MMKHPDFYAGVGGANLILATVCGLLYFLVGTLLWRLLCEIIYIILLYFKTNTKSNNEQEINSDGGITIKFNGPLFVVDDIAKSRNFYCSIFGLNVVMDFGANITFDAGFSLQSKDFWSQFIQKPESEIIYGGNDAELYFEEDNFDEFVKKLKTLSDIEYVHDVIEHGWGQRVVRIYDPDKHIIEIGENMKVVCKRFLDSGMSVEETSRKTQHPVEFVKACQ